MNISYNWLRELTGGRLAPRELAARLTMAGLAVDAVHEAGGDFVLEFDLTSNRPDCLSHLGIAREVAALEGGAVRLPDVEVSATGEMAADFASVEIEDASLCPRYAARVVRGVRVGPSPAWLAERLQAIGQRPINNVTDITNFVLFEQGQPLHAFDLATLTDRKIIVRRARAGERLKTLDGVERELDEEMLVIADAARAVALAGVMGGEETEISERTTDVLIESAYFEPTSVRRTSKALGLQTEASRRFERGTDIEGVRRAQDRCVALICELAGGTATVDAVDVYPRKIAPPVVGLRPRRVRELTGLNVPAGESIRILNSLGFVREEEANGARRAAAGAGVGPESSPAEGAERALFRVPTWRVDVSIEDDLVEEVARHFGYDKIEDALPPSTSVGEYRPSETRRRAARRALAALGFDEAVNYSFIDAREERRFELIAGLLTGGGGDGGGFVTLENPIIEGATLMRPTLLAGLLQNVRHNFNHGTRNLRLFEMGRVFAAASAPGGRPAELEALALVLTGGALEEERAAAPRELDFHDLKGALEAAVADSLNLEGLEFRACSARHLREGQAAEVFIDGEKVGTLGRLGEEVAADYKFRQAVYVAEVSFSALLARSESPARYSPLARFPSVVRDVTLLVGRRTTFADLRRAVNGLGLKHLRGVAFVGVYEGANLPEGKRSVTLRVEYRADERTLRDEEAEALHARVVEALERESGA